MIEISKLDNFLLLLGFLIVIGLFTLAFAVYQEGGECILDPIKYAIENNITNPYFFNIP